MKYYNTIYYDLDKNFSQKNFIYFWSLLKKMLADLGESINNVYNELNNKIDNQNSSIIDSINNTFDTLHDELKGDINQLRTDMTTADNTLQSNIDKLRQDMTSADTTLQNNINQLRTNMTTADNSINTEITNIKNIIRVPESVLPGASSAKVGDVLAILDNSKKVGWVTPTVNGATGGTINGNVNITGSLTINGKAITVNVFSVGAAAPADRKIFWIDTNTGTGGLKYHNGSAWVQVPVAFSP